MTLLTHRGEGPAFPYAGQPMHILAGQDGLPSGFAAMELTVPPHFAGPVPHAHDEFDEAIYVLSGRLLVHGDDEPAEAGPGSLFVAPRGHRHGLQQPDRRGRPGARHLGATRTRPGLHARVRRRAGPGHPARPGAHGDIDARHASRLLPLNGAAPASGHGHVLTKWPQQSQASQRWDWAQPQRCGIAVVLTTAMPH
jgi:Cupin domain